MTGMLTDELFEQLKQDYKRSSLLKDELVVDVNFSVEEALCTQSVPASWKAEHEFRAPHLTLMPVLYYGLEKYPKIHFGQLVVVTCMERVAGSLFKALFRSRFGLQRVVPASAYGYDPQAITKANATTGYRLNKTPSGNLTEHARGWAIDFNPLLNPVRIERNGKVENDPEPAVHNPNILGTITLDSLARKHFATHEFEWGGNWGDLHAVPVDEYLFHGYFVYRHIEPNSVLRSRLKAQLPSVW